MNMIIATAVAIVVFTLINIGSEIVIALNNIANELRQLK